MTDTPAFPQFEPYPEEFHLYRVEFDSRTGISGVEYLPTLSLIPTLLHNYGLDVEACDLRIETFNLYCERMEEQREAENIEHRLRRVREEVNL